MKPCRRWTTLLRLAGAWLAIWMSAPAAGDTFYVSNTAYTPGLEDGTSAHPFSTIQRAINLLPSEAEVVVAQGTYVENINFYGKLITLRSTDPGSPAVVAATVIDGNRAGSVVTFDHGEDSASVLKGFTLRGGQAYLGGGVYCFGSSPTIQGNVICDNRAAGQPWVSGGGIYSSGGSPTITGNTIRSNTVEAPAPGPGASWCQVSGGGLGLSGGQPKVLNNLIDSNCIVVPNGYDDPESTGGGVALLTWAPGAQFENNTVVGNEVTGANGSGGGIYWEANASSPVLSNCVVHSNVAASGSQFLGDAWDWATSFEVRDCDLGGGDIMIRGGALHVASPALWNMDNTLDLRAAVVSGSTMTVTGSLAASDGFSKVLCKAVFASSPSVHVAEESDMLLLAGGFALAPGATLTKTGLGSLTVAAECPQSHGSGSSLVVAAGALHLNSDTGAGGANLTIHLADGTTAVFGSPQNLAGLKAAGAARIDDGGYAVTTGAFEIEAGASLTKVGGGTFTVNGSATTGAGAVVDFGSSEVAFCGTASLGGTSLMAGNVTADVFSLNSGTATVNNLTGYSSGSHKTVLVDVGTTLTANGLVSGWRTLQVNGVLNGTGSVWVGAASLEGTGTIAGPVTLTGDSTLTSTGTLTITSTLTVQGLANQLSSGTVNTTDDVTIDHDAVFIINGTLGGEDGSLIVRGTLMGKGTINKDCILDGGTLSPGEPSTIKTTGQVRAAAAPRTFSFEIGAAGPNYASPSNSVNDVLRLTDAATPFADASGGAPAALSADTVIDVYFLWATPALGEYKAEFFAATDFSDAVAGATYEYWRLDPRGSRYHNGNFYSPLDESLVDWSVVPETATFDGAPASGYITQFSVAPEPATLALLLVGIAGALLRRMGR